MPKTIGEPQADDYAPRSGATGVVLIVLFATAVLACHRPVLVPQPHLLDEALGVELDESIAINAVAGAEYFVVNDEEAVRSLRHRLGIPLFADTDIDFEREMIVGSVAAPEARQRDYRLLRVLYTPEAIEVHIVSYARDDVDAPLTPYVFARIPSAEASVHFFLNDRLVSAADLTPLAPGTHELIRTARQHYAVVIPNGLQTPAPLLVFLHSSGSSGSRWAPAFDALAAKYGFVVLVPTARNGYYWTGNRDFTAIIDAIDEVRLRIPIDSERIYVAGNSAGGHAAYPLALTYPEIFKGVVASAGRLSRNVSDALLEKGRGMPVLILCGENDTTVPIEKVREGAARLERHGLQVTLRAYPTGHAVLAPGTGALDEMFRWLSQLANGTHAPAQSGKNVTPRSGVNAGESR